MKLRLALDKDTAQIRELWEYCFDDSEEFVNYYFNRRFKLDNTIVVTDEANSKVYAALQMNHYKIKFANKEIPTSYIVGISTLPEKRGNGLMKQLLPYALKELYNKDQSFVLMMATDSRLYLKYQFTFIVDMNIFNLKTKNCKSEKNNLEIIKANENDIDILAALYAKDHAHSQVYVHRDSNFYKELFKELATEDKYIYLVKDPISSEYTGYIIYSIEDNCFNVREWCYLNINTLYRLMNYIYQHNMQADNAEIIVASDDYLKNITPINKDTEIYLFPFMMGRIINVEKFFNYRIPSINNREVSISVNDSYLKANNKTFLLASYNGLLKANETAKKPQLEISIDTLTQLACGYISVDEARKVDLIRIFDESGYNSLQKMFRKAINYVNEYV